MIEHAPPAQKKKKKEEEITLTGGEIEEILPVTDAGTRQSPAHWQREEKRTKRKNKPPTVIIKWNRQNRQANRGGVVLPAVNL